MKKFNTLVESILDELNSLEEFESEVKPQLKSYNEFKHFCKQLDLITKLDSNFNKDVDSAIECSLYFIKQVDDNNNLIRFDFFNQTSNEYFNKYADIFNTLINYKNKYIVTLTGKSDSPKIIWG